MGPPPNKGQKGGPTALLWTLAAVGGIALSAAALTIRDSKRRPQASDGAAAATPAAANLEEGDAVVLASARERAVHLLGSSDLPEDCLTSLEDLHQVGGHRQSAFKPGMLLLRLPGRAPAVLKPLQTGGRGLREVRFYESVARGHGRLWKLLQELTPPYLGVARVAGAGGSAFDGVDFLVLADVTHGYAAPCVMDVKMGTRTYEPTAPVEKKRSETLKYPPQEVTGFRVVGTRGYVWEEDDSSASGYRRRPRRRDKRWGLALSAEEAALGFAEFFHDGQGVVSKAVEAVLPRLRGLFELMREQRLFHFVSTSLLFIWDSDGPPGDYEGRGSRGRNSSRASIYMIDFTHALPLAGERPPRDEGYIYGLRNVIAVLEELLALQEEAQQLRLPAGMPPAAYAARVTHMRRVAALLPSAGSPGRGRRASRSPSPSRRASRAGGDDLWALRPASPAVATAAAATLGALATDSEHQNGWGHPENTQAPPGNSHSLGPLLSPSSDRPRGRRRSAAEAGARNFSRSPSRRSVDSRDAAAEQMEVHAAAAMVRLSPPSPVAPAAPARDAAAAAAAAAAAGAAESARCNGNGIRVATAATAAGNSETENEEEDVSPRRRRHRHHLTNAYTADIARLAAEAEAANVTQDPAFERLHQELQQRLSKCLEELDESTAELARYREREAIGEDVFSNALALTMAILKGEVIRLSPRHVDGLGRLSRICAHGPEQCARQFKAAHLAIKAAVVAMAGEQRPNERWHIPEGAFELLPAHQVHKLLEALRLLVVSFDLMASADKKALGTVVEIIENRAHLVDMAERCVARENAAHGPRPAVHVANNGSANGAGANGIGGGGGGGNGAAGKRGRGSPDLGNGVREGLGNGGGGVPLPQAFRRWSTATALADVQNPHSPVAAAPAPAAAAGMPRRSSASVATRASVATAGWHEPPGFTMSPLKPPPPPQQRHRDGADTHSTATPERALSDAVSFPVLASTTVAAAGGNGLLSPLSAAQRTPPRGPSPPPSRRASALLPAAAAQNYSDSDGSADGDDLLMEAKMAIDMSAEAIDRVLGRSAAAAAAGAGSPPGTTGSSPARSRW